MIEAGGELARALADGSLAHIVGPNSPHAAEVAELSARYLRGLTVAVSGRPGVGRDTMTRALRQRLSIAALGPGEDEDATADVDLWLHVVVSAPRAADHEALALLPADRTIVVLGKADTHGDPTVANAAAASAAAALRRPVLPVSGLLACADVTADEWDYLRSLVADGVEMPSMAGHFLVGPPGSRTRALRLALLRRLDQFGIDTALGLFTDHPDVIPDVDSLNTALHRCSGISALTPLIAEHVDRVRYWRGTDLRAGLERVAADLTHDQPAHAHPTDSALVDRDQIERLLRVSVVHT